MGFKKLENAVFESEDWRDEIVSKDKLKKGFALLDFQGSRSDWSLKAGSVFDVDGVFYLIETDESFTGLSEGDSISFDGTTFFTTSYPSFSYSSAKRGFYIDSTDQRIVGYFDGTDFQTIESRPGTSDLIRTEEIKPKDRGVIFGGDLYFSGITATTRIVPNRVLTGLQRIDGAWFDAPYSLLALTSEVDPQKASNDFFALNITGSFEAVSKSANKGAIFNYSGFQSLNSHGFTDIVRDSINGWIQMFDRAGGTYAHRSTNDGSSFSESAFGSVVYGVGMRNGAWCCVGQSQYIYRLSGTVGAISQSVTGIDFLDVACNNVASPGERWVFAGTSGNLFYLDDINSQTALSEPQTACTLDVATTEDFNFVVFNEIDEKFYAVTDSELYTSADGETFTQVLTGLDAIDDILATRIGLIVTRGEDLFFLTDKYVFIPVCKIVSGGRLALLGNSEFAYVNGGFAQIYSL